MSKLRELAFDELHLIIQNNLEKLDPRSEKFTIDMNEVVERMIDKIKDKHNMTSDIILDQIDYIKDNFFTHLMMRIYFLYRHNLQ